MRSILTSLTLAALLASPLGACSRTPPPMTDSIEKAQKDGDTAKRIEQSMQKKDAQPGQ